MTLAPEAPATPAGDPYYEALEHISRQHRQFKSFLQERISLAYRNAAAHENQSGRTAHRDRATAAEIQYILQQFERLLG